MGDPAAGGEIVDVAVAGAVKGEVAQEAAQVGIVCSAGAAGEECPAGLREVVFPGQAVHPAAFRVERVVGEGLVVEEQVRAMKANVEQIFFLKKIVSGFLGQGFQDVLTEAVVCVCGGHDILLCLCLLCADNNILITVPSIIKTFGLPVAKKRELW